ncbi:MAG: hypothetical protein HY698_06435 [Deltaproteobacteria bacterium]|nr:hypothetical protein [Deltaproteobacteria bacterium]
MPIHLSRSFLAGSLLMTLLACGDGTSPKSAGGDPDAFVPVETADARAEEPDADPLSGLDASYLDELRPEEWAALCQWMASVQGGPRTVRCDGGISVTVNPVAECLAQSERPHCTVGSLRACVSAEALDLCASAPAECRVFYECAG